ncbi:MAG: DUF3800 domain-containing protein [Candidatus Binatia bacterium]
MYLLYLDESGNEGDAKDKHFVLAGIAVFERVTFFLSKYLDEVQTRHFPGIQPIPFHASHIRSGMDFWRKVTPELRTKVLQDVGKVITRAKYPGAVLFAAVVEKSDRLFGEKAVEYATEAICKRFDTFLINRGVEASEKQRGLLIFSEGRFHQRARIWVTGFRELGTRWGALRCLSDIPYFASMRDTRLLQIADFVAYAVFQLYEKRDPTLIRPILHRFNEQNGTLHGLIHYRINPTSSSCECPACVSRNTPSNFGSWL